MPRTIYLKVWNMNNILKSGKKIKRLKNNFLLLNPPVMAIVVQNINK